MAGEPSNRAPTFQLKVTWDVGWRAAIAPLSSDGHALKEGVQIVVGLRARSVRTHITTFSFDLVRQGNKGGQNKVETTRLAPTDPGSLIVDTVAST